MIPRNSQGRRAGNGGGGNSKSGSITPYFCKKCNKTKPASQFLDSCDVCKTCRVRK